MRKNILLLAGFLFIAVSVFAQKSKAKLKNELDSVSYNLGTALGTSFKKAGFSTINEKLFLQALTEAISGTEPLFTEDEMNKNIQAYMMKLHDKKLAENKVKGQKFLEENKKKDSIVSLPSGLQYKILKEGQGESPKLTDKVTCHYHGTLIDGKVFDSSVQRGEPVQFPVNGVIKGWTEALQLMKPGSKWKLYIPSDLAYGESQMPGSPIEPNSVLIFDVELISVDSSEPGESPVQQ